MICPTCYRAFPDRWVRNPLMMYECTCLRCIGNSGNPVKIFAIYTLNELRENKIT